MDSNTKVYVDRHAHFKHFFFFSLFLGMSKASDNTKAAMKKQLEHALPISTHANGKYLLKWTSSLSQSFHVCNYSACCLVCNGNGSALTSKASSKVNLLNDDTYR